MVKAISVLLFCGLLGGAAIGAEQPKVKPPEVKRGDLLELSLKEMPKGEMDLWNGNYRVNDAGEIVLPLLGRFKVSGMTLEEAANAIEKELRNRDIYRNPDLDLQFPKAAIQAPKKN